MKYKITNKTRGNTRVDLQNSEHVFIDLNEEKIVESAPVFLTEGLEIKEIKEKKKSKED